MLTTVAAAVPHDMSDGGEAIAHAAANSLIPGHQFASWMLHIIDTILNWFGLRHSHLLEQLLYTAIVLLVAAAVGWVLRKLLILIGGKVMMLRHLPDNHRAQIMRTLTTCSHVIPAIVFLGLIPFAFSRNHVALDWILRGAGVYTLVMIGMAICSVLLLVWERFDERANRDNHPLKGVLNVGRGLVWIIIFIISVSIIVDRSPMTLLAGLGAFAAALMLIFKDSILGFVAGIQLSQNDMLRVGDWIVVPNTMANGIVTDVTLTVVKVQNWDNTLVTLPPYTLVSTSFQNWRNMAAIGYRQISRIIYFDSNSIRPIAAQEVADLTARFPVMQQFVEQMQKAKADAPAGENAAVYGQVYNLSDSPNGTIDTNLGLFRAYTTCYLKAHPQIKTGDGMDLIVTLKQMAPYGMALNVYCFSRMTAWAKYEALQSQILEHLHAVAPAFGLRIYNAPDSNTFTLASPKA